MKNAQKKERKLEIIKKAYDIFALHCVPHDACPQQRQDMQTSFYAGAHGLLLSMVVYINSEKTPNSPLIKFMMYEAIVKEAIDEINEYRINIAESGEIGMNAELQEILDLIMKK